MSTAPVAETPAPAQQLRLGGAGTPRPMLVAVALIVLLGAALRFWRLGHQSFWYDEALTVGVVHHSFGGLPSLVRHTEGVPPLYFYLGWIWAHIFGDGEVGLRSLSAVAGTGVVPVMYAAGARLLSRRAGLIAAAVAACNPFLIWYSQEAREYSVLALAAAVSILAFAHLLSPGASSPPPPAPRLISPRPSAGWLAIWALASSLALATHYFAVLIVVPEAIWLLWLHRRRRDVWLAVCLVGVAGALLGWFALGQKSNDAAWITGAPLGMRLGQAVPQFLLGMGAPARTWLKLGGLAALMISAGGLVFAADLRERLGALRVAALTGSAFVLSLLLAAGGLDRIISRNLLVVLLGLILLVAGGLAVRRWRGVGLAAATLLCAIGIAATVAVAFDEQFQRPPWRAVGRVLTSERPTGTTAAVIVENNDSFIPIADYVPGLRPLFFGVPVGELDVVAAVKAPTVFFCWWGAVCSLPLAPLDTSIHVPGFRAAGRVVHVDQFAIYRLRAAKPVVVTAGAIAHALSSAHLRSYGLFVAP